MEDLAPAGSSEPANPIEQVPYLRRAPRSYEQFEWTEARSDELKDLWGKIRARDIAERLGVSKNAVLGRAHRLGLKRLRDPGVRGITSPRKRPAPKRALGNHVAGKVRRIPVCVADQLTDLPQEQSASPVSLLDSQQHHCRWPLGEPTADMLVCGDTKVVGYPYCARHWLLAYRKEVA